MLCIHCGDQVCFRCETEGLIHKNGKYVCRNHKPGDKFTVASVGDAAAEKRLRVAAMVKLPISKPESVQRGRQRKAKDEDYDRYL